MHKSFLAYVLLLSLFCAIAQAQTNSWTGAASDSDWHNANNWSLLEVPTASHDVSVPTASNVTISADAACLSLSLNGVSLITLDANLAVAENLSIDFKTQLEWFSGQLEVAGELQNSGTLMLTGFSERQLHATTLTNDGQLLIKDTNLTRISGGSVINNTATGTIIIDSVGGILSNIGEATLNNQGLLQKTSSSGDVGNFYLILAINNTGIIDVTENQIVLILGGAAQLHNLENGRIQGNGFYDITGEFTNIGSVAPGGISEVGTLSVINVFTINNPGTLVLDIEGSSSGEYDKIEVTGSPAVEADIQLNLSYEAAIGDTFEVLTATPSGISACNLPTTITTVYLDQLYTFSVSCLTDHISLEVIDKVLSVAEQTLNQPVFTINPNPVSEQAVILYKASSPKSDQYQVAIHNVLGQRVNQFVIRPNEPYLFERNRLKTGIYLVQVLDGNTLVASTKMIVK